MTRSRHLKQEALIKQANEEQRRINVFELTEKTAECESVQEILEDYFEEKTNMERMIIKSFNGEATPFTVEEANDYFNVENKYAKKIEEFNNRTFVISNKSKEN